MFLNSLLRSLGTSLFLFFISSFSSNLFAQDCNIEITITGRTVKWADRVFFQLIDGSNNVVLHGVPMVMVLLLKPILTMV